MFDVVVIIDVLVSNYSVKIVVVESWFDQGVFLIDFGIEQINGWYVFVWLSDVFGEVFDEIICYFREFIGEYCGCVGCMLDFGNVFGRKQQQFDCGVVIMDRENDYFWKVELCVVVFDGQFQVLSQFINFFYLICEVLECLLYFCLWIVWQCCWVVMLEGLEVGGMDMFDWFDVGFFGDFVFLYFGECIVMKDCVEDIVCIVGYEECDMVDIVCGDGYSFLLCFFVFVFESCWFYFWCKFNFKIDFIGG